MRARKMTARQVGDMLGRSAQTVRGWRCTHEGRSIPAHCLELLNMKLAAKDSAANG